MSNRRTPNNQTHTQSDAGQQGSPSRQLTAVLMLVAAGIIGIALYIALKGDDPRPPDPLPPPKGGTVTVNEVLEAARTVIKGGTQADLDAAARLMTEYVQKNPDDVAVRPLLADTLHRLGRNGEAEMTVDEVLRRPPANAPMLYLKGQLVRIRNGGDWLARLRSAAKVATDSPTDASPKIWTDFALELLALGQDDEAAGYLEQAAAKTPDDAGVLLGFGELALHRGHHDAAVQQLDKSIQRDKANPRTYIALAAAHQAGGAPAQAVATLRAGLANCPARGALNLQLGRMLLARQDYEPAAAALEQAAREAASNPEAFFLAAQAFYHLGLKHQQGQMGKAMWHIDQSLELAPGNADYQEWNRRIEDARFVRD